MAKETFFVCKHCGNLVETVKNSGAPMTCCGEKMTELVANTVEAATEKHIPEVKIDGDTISVKVGSVTHPMLAEHYIEFICVKTAKGSYRKMLKPTDEPVAVFKLVDDTAVTVFEYCNIHGLWKLDV